MQENNFARGEEIACRNIMQYSKYNFSKRCMCIEKLFNKINVGYQRADIILLKVKC